MTSLLIDDAQGTRHGSPSCLPLRDTYALGVDCTNRCCLLKRLKSNCIVIPRTQQLQDSKLLQRLVDGWLRPAKIRC